jgi:hypothetical protein
LLLPSCIIVAAALTIIIITMGGKAHATSPRTRRRRRTWRFVWRPFFFFFLSVQPPEQDAPPTHLDESTFCAYLSTCTELLMIQSPNSEPTVVRARITTSRPAWDVAGSRTGQPPKPTPHAEMSPAPCCRSRGCARARPFSLVPIFFFFSRCRGRRPRGPFVAKPHGGSIAPLTLSFFSS